MLSPNFPSAGHRMVRSGAPFKLDPEVRGAPDMAALRRDLESIAQRDPASADALRVTVEARMTPVEAGRLRAAIGDALHRGGLDGPAHLRFAQAFGADPRIPREYTLEGIVDAIGRGLSERADSAARNGREAMLDASVGVPLRATEALFNRTGHQDAATVRREFRTGEGPRHRVFGAGHAFSVGFAASMTTREHVRTALANWKTRPGGLSANGGTYTNYRGTFVPIAAGDVDRGAPVKIIGTPEAHVIGSFAMSGRLLDAETVEWTAQNTMSLRSYFAANWIDRLGFSLVDNNQRPGAYGNTQQTIVWRTDLDGNVQ
jgi:hypothetical protein